MKGYLYILLTIATFCTIHAQDRSDFEKISFTEFFGMIEEEPDSIFKLENAIIYYNKETDSLSTTVKDEFLNPRSISQDAERRVINKQIELDNVFFQTVYSSNNLKSDTTEVRYRSGILVNLHFKKTVGLRNVMGLNLFESVFEDQFSLHNIDICDLDRRFMRDNKLNVFTEIGLNHFKKGMLVTQNCINDKIGFYQIFKNKIAVNADPRSYNYIFLSGTSYGAMLKNEILGKGENRILLNKCYNLDFVGNTFETINNIISLRGDHDKWLFKENTFENGVKLSLANLKPSDVIDFNQFDNKTLSADAFSNYASLLSDEEYKEVSSDNFIINYREKLRYQDIEIFSAESALKGVLYRHYRENFNMVSANKAYMNLKDFETKHLKYNFDTNPTFDNYFQWKVNQFLKVFSNYGTKPSKAIVFSVYVIFLFALIYLFFPNSWDRHGRKRIVDRYTFFLKYIDEKAGIHEVYLDDKREALLDFEEFKDLINSKEKKVPGIFTATAMPLYKWAVSGTRFSAAVLKRMDIVSGTWVELPKSQRLWKSLLLSGAFLVAILYDLLIKILNALMLSINTFTTLGFGEIPIKGLPRYLAIIQGFIGWFMLTIFSVSLISQLLN
jgi:hypothetical protein